MAMERQQAFGWLIALDLFLGGAGGGLFLVSFLLDLFGKYEPIARIGAICGPILVLIGTLLLIVDLGTKTNLHRLVLNLSSWVSRGTWILIVFIILGLGYSLPMFEPFNWLPWNNAAPLGKLIGVIAAIFSIGVALYAGFLLGAIKSIPFWNTSVLPILFLVSSICMGIAILLFIATLSPLSLGEEMVSFLNTLSIAEIALVLFQLLLLWAYVEIALRGNVASIKSASELKGRSFIVGVITIGLLIPLGLLFWGITVSEIPLLSVLIWIATILILAGGLFLRREILRAGIHLPRFVI